MRWIKWLAATLLLLFLLLAAALYWLQSALKEDQPQMFLPPQYDTAPAALPIDFDDARPAVLIFSKTNGFRHHAAIAAAREMFDEMAERRGWSLLQTENAEFFAPQLLAHFDVVVWSNATGPLLTDSQRDAFEGFLRTGGGYVGIHAAGDASHPRWYREQLIGAHFSGHPLFPQRQRGRVETLVTEHPALAHLPSSWEHEEEWYCFDDSPRAAGVDVLARLDERDINFWTIDHRDGFAFRNLAMGEDHPLIWSRQWQAGRLFYSALGHYADSYRQPALREMLEQAIVWSGRLPES